MNEVYSCNQNKALNYLDTIKKLSERIKSRGLEIDALRYSASGAGGIQYDKDRVQTSPEDRLALIIDDILEKEKEQDEDIDRLYDLKCEVYSYIRRLSDEYERIFLEYVYINNMTINIAANKMHMSERNLYNVRLNALENFGLLL